MTSPTKFTPKQQRFIDFYDGNATKAAKLAGYTGNSNTLAQMGDENLKKPKIIQAIKDREAKRNQSTIANREERQQFWTESMRDKETDIKDRQKASELLGRSEADFTDNTRISDPDGKALSWRIEIVPVVPRIEG